MPLVVVRPSLLVAVVFMRSGSHPSRILEVFIGSMPEVGHSAVVEHSLVFLAFPVALAELMPFIVLDVVTLIYINK
jgi:hypothetical protein